MADLAELTSSIAAGNRNEAKRLTQAAIEQGLPARGVLDALVAGMDEIGRRFQCNQAFVPQMLIAARAMKESVGILEPVMVKAGIVPDLTAVIGTVQGDLHDIGKNLVAMMWRGANFRVVDLGINVPPGKFVEAAAEQKPAVIGLSALLTTTMPAMRETVTVLRSAGVAARIVVGGAPVTEAFARAIGADGFAPDAASAVELVRKLCVASSAACDAPALRSPPCLAFCASGI